MRSKLLILSIIIAALIFSGCTNQERVALGGIAGASGGMLAVDTTNRYMGYGNSYGNSYGNRYSNGGYRQSYYGGNKGYNNYQYRDHRYGNSSQVDGRSYPGTHRPGPGQYPRY